MSELVDVAATADLGEGVMKSVEVNGKEVLLVMIDGNCYAVDNLCPHMKGDLSTGTLEGYTVTCPRHGSQFDVRTGKNTRWMQGSGIVSKVSSAVKSEKSLTSYKVEVQGDRILVEVS